MELATAAESCRIAYTLVLAPSRGRTLNREREYDSLPLSHTTTKVRLRSMTNGERPSREGAR